MKKSLFKEYEALIRPHVSEFYARAYAVKGNRAEAEALTVEAIVWGASKFSGLAKKERIIELISSHIGDGTHIPAEVTDEKVLISRAMKRINEKGKLKTLILGVGSCVLAAAILAVSIPNLPYDEWFPEETTTQTDAEGNLVQPVIGAVTMKNTKTIQGDNNIVSLENYHNLSKALKKNTKPNDRHADMYTEIERYAVSITAPDGTTYMAFNNITNEDTGNITFDLYRMETDSWNKVAEGESQVMHSTGSYNNYFASRIYLVADKESNIYVLVLLDDAVTVYRYDCKTGEFTKSNTALASAAPSKYTIFSIYYDETFGECGGIYVGYAKNSKYHFSCYDIAKDEYVNIAEKVCSSIDSRMAFCVDRSVVHMIVQEAYNLRYYRIGADGTYQSKILHTGSLYAEMEYVFNRNSGAGGIAVDKNGFIHIVATHRDAQENANKMYELVHYKINSDLTFEKESLSKLYYTTANSYDPMGMGVFTDSNGNVYYIEKYKPYAVDSMNVFAIGRFNDDSSVTCVDVLELPNGITYGGSRLMNNIITFYSDNDIYYFEIEGLGD